MKRTLALLAGALVAALALAACGEKTRHADPDRRPGAAAER